ncbi:hypothetical protein ACFVZR_38990 [Streptomyces sp. NPDC058316]|uniref:hypothetical protein n=1 Tax=Streptomyces sp. NPDC058316 TaxID=3346442 RepID=UPI0036E62FED
MTRMKTLKTGSANLTKDIEAPPRGSSRATDIVYDGRLLDDIHGADQKNYVATIARLRNLPVTVLHPGHESPFDGTRLREITDAYIATRP